MDLHILFFINENTGLFFLWGLCLMGLLSSGAFLLELSFYQKVYEAINGVTPQKNLGGKHVFLGEQRIRRA